MKRLLLPALLLFGAFETAQAQLYFPPNGSTAWETTDPATLGWCQDSIDVLYDYLDQTNSKAFILLKDGRIVLERYFDGFTADSLWVWNSAGKTLTAVAVGIAQQEGYLHLSDTTSDYLGTGWTSLTPTQEERITIRHQLTMTSGLDDSGDIYCTDPACLNYLADPGDRWAYHNAPYTLLGNVIEDATGVTLNQWTTQKIKNPTGMTGLYVPIDYNNIFISNARSMARFGLLLHAEGIWNGTPVLDDPDYFYDMTHSSQTMNESYGYLTWLNGQDTYMVPGLQVQIIGSPMPSAPDDLFAALGKDGQIINVVPSTGIVVVRMGENDNNSLVSSQYNDTIWQHINNLSCPAALSEGSLASASIFPNPVNDETSQILTINGLQPEDRISVATLTGTVLELPLVNDQLDVSGLEAGIYLITINRSEQRKTIRLLVN